MNYFIVGGLFDNIVATVLIAVFALGLFAGVLYCWDNIIGLFGYENVSPAVERYRNSTSSEDERHYERMTDIQLEGYEKEFNERDRIAGRGTTWAE